MLTANYLRKILSYDPATGRFQWQWDNNKKPNINSRDTKKIAGSIGLNHRRAIKIKGKRYYCSRLAWLYVTGNWPVAEIDHINGDTLDDRIVNLRDCSRAENQRNVGVTARNTSGTKGVYWNSRAQAWLAQIRVGGKTHYLGTFRSSADAAVAYARAAKELHGDFWRVK